MSNLNQILIALGGPSVLLVVLAFLARSLLQTWLAKDIKRFESDLRNTADNKLEQLKQDLKYKGDASIEQLRSELQQSATEHQVRFSNLHEQRAQRIADLYGRIVEQSVACRRYVVQLGTSNREEGYMELEKSFADMYLFFETSRVYLPEHICNLLEKVFSALRGPVIDIYVYSGVDNYAPDEVRKERNAAFLNALKAFEADIPSARRALEDEFRKILGVERERGAT
jgi:hypothetical protein